MTYVQLEPDEFRTVRVQLDDGLWVPGRLMSYRQVEGTWSGLVTFELTAGESQEEWFEQGRIRGAELG